MSFHLKCDDEVLSFIVAEAAAAGCSRTAYINQVLTALFQVPTFLTRGNRLQELTACSKLFNEETMRDLPSLAKKSDDIRIRCCFGLWMRVLRETGA